MKNIILFLSLFFISMNSNSQSVYSDKLAHTYSIVARDPVTGEMGVAVQSHWFSVGSIVSWGEAGVGVVATQSFVNPSFGVKGLQLLKEGKSPQETVDELIAADEGRDVRQLAILDAKGRSASYTGKYCIPEAGNIAKENYSVQANMMLTDKVWSAMSAAFENSTGPLAERMIAALEAAEKEGGDIRGKQSACILVVRGESTGKIWEDRLIDLRVEDHSEPVEELKRLLKVFRAYEHMNNGDVAIEKNDMDLAMKEYSAAEEMFPENAEMKFWHAVTLANTGGVDASLPLFTEVFRTDNNWRILFGRLKSVGLLELSDDDIRKISELD
ncbi:MAG TPA: DUF1028 domain-containing protein [Ignavibacteria bacterium]|nr:Zn-dependent protease [Bacteroidota bacterium]HRI84975.1 DUF1028 domain-containing protein [Ignavibacteria bacterium]HRK00850.1 DUF1028 domain-containing protein [Ignavibacteria bacterium]